MTTTQNRSWLMRTTLAGAVALGALSAGGLAHANEGDYTDCRDINNGNRIFVGGVTNPEPYCGYYTGQDPPTPEHPNNKPYQECYVWLVKVAVCNS